MNIFSDFMDDVLGKKPPPHLPNTRAAVSEDIPASGRRRGIVGLGEPSSGKTASMARMMVDHLIEHPEESMVSFDGSEDFTNKFINIALSKPPAIRDPLLKRIVYDELGHKKFTHTFPVLTESEPTELEREVQMGIQDFEALNPELMKQTPVVGGASVKQYGTELLRLLGVMKTEFGGPWQLTEAKFLLMDKLLLAWALNKFGDHAYSAKWLFENSYKKLKAEDARLTSLGLLSVLEDIEAPEIRSRIGFHRATYNMKDLIEGGKILLVNAHRVNYQKKTLAFLLTQIMTRFIAEIAKRTPNNPNDPPVTFMVDELPSLLEYSNTQERVKSMPSYFRNRKLQPVIIAQNLDQFPKDLRPHIWGYANIICFKLLNMDDCEEVAKQLFPYVPTTLKSVNIEGQEIYEAAQGHYLQIANQIHNLGHRHCIGRKQISETEAERYTFYVKQTKEAVMTATDREVNEFKEEKMQEGERIDEVNASINRRIKEAQKPSNAGAEPPNAS
jgi:hypothetical protein